MADAAGDDALLGAYLDGELSAGETLALERRLAAEPALAARLARFQALSAHVARNLPPPTLPSRLAERARALAHSPRRRLVAVSLAASWVLAAALGAGGALLLPRDTSEPGLDDMAVASHVRALMAREPIDVSSSDPHTVKPWFAGRLPQAPRVVDLTGEGFPLVGGRIDVIGRTPAPALVYRHRRHLISLIAVPDGAQRAPGTRQVNGYTALSWADGSVRYWAVSDLGRTDLERFVQLFRAAPTTP